MGIRRYLERRRREKFYNQDLGAPTEAERGILQDFQNAIRSLAPIADGESSSSATWTGFRNQFRQEVLNGDPRKFTAFPAIMASMYCIPKPLEFEAIKTHPRLSELKPKKWGTPKPYPGLAIDENTVHHFYVLERLLSQVPDLNSFDHIVEFGGGYGNLNTILRDLNFKGDHIIFDMPEFSALQRFFIAGNGYLKKYPNVRFVGEFTELKSMTRNFKPEKTLLLGHWSISEAPLAVREPLFEAVPAKNFFFCCQGQFDSVDNVQYFADFAKRHPDVHWIKENFDHLRTSFSLVGIGQK